MSGLLTEKAEINKTQPCVNWPYSSLTSGMPEGIEAGILNTCNLVISALKAKMIYWSLHHALLFSTMIQNRGCLVHNSDMQTSSVPSICSVAKNTEHIMFSTLKAMTEDYSTGWAGKKGRKLSVACICRAFQLWVASAAWSTWLILNAEVLHLALAVPYCYFLCFSPEYYPKIL